jgi:septum formation protein
MNWFPDYNYILASKSPRRQQLLQSLGIQFEVRVKETDEIYPEGLDRCEIPVYLAKLKAAAFLPELKERDLLITADTIVFLENEVIGKPDDLQDAKRMLKKLSGKEHQVISGVCITSVQRELAFFAVTNVRFKKLSKKEIDFYISNFLPFDKAGAYGIQEWIGYIGITHIEGSFYNVMGLPVQRLYEEIMRF